MNSLRVLLGVAIVTIQPKLYEDVASTLGDNIGAFTSSYTQASQEVSKKMMNLLNLALQAAIVTENTSLVEQTLKFGHENTFILTCSDSALVYALL